MNDNNGVEHKTSHRTAEEVESHEHMEHDMQHMNHADHEQAMTDPRMAAFMEKDMRNRFLWSLIFTFVTSSVLFKYRRKWQCFCPMAST